MSVVNDSIKEWRVWIGLLVRHTQYCPTLAYIIIPGLVLFQQIYILRKKFSDAIASYNSNWWPVIAIIFAAMNIFFINSKIDTNVLCVWNYNYFPSHLVYSFYVGCIPNYLISDTELLKQILIKQFDNFTDRLPVSKSCNCYDYWTITGLFHKPLATQGFGEIFLDQETPDLLFMPGDAWRQIRRIVTPAFSSRNLKRVGKNLIICDFLQTGM